MVAARLVSTIAATHLALALVVGRPLLHQHYAMLVPILYLGAAIVVGRCIGLVATTRRPGGASPTRRMAATCLLVAAWGMAVSWQALRSERVLERLQATGGDGYYSDAINEVGALLAALPAGTVALFPQWGGWMGAAVVSGGSMPIWEAASLEQMAERVAHDRTASRFMLVLSTASAETQRAQFLRSTGMMADRTIAGEGLRHDVPGVALTEFASRTGLLVSESRIVMGRNGRDALLVSLLHRLK